MVTVLASYSTPPQSNEYGRLLGIDGTGSPVERQAYRALTARQSISIAEKNTVRLGSL
jgi:hypothetical protein